VRWAQAQAEEDKEERMIWELVPLMLEVTLLLLAIGRIFSGLTVAYRQYMLLYLDT
jgi:hypothetical protein